MLVLTLYAWAVVLPAAESPQLFNRLVQQAVERHFGLATAIEIRANVPTLVVRPQANG